MEIKEEELELLNTLFDVFEIDRFNEGFSHVEEVGVEDNTFKFRGLDIVNNNIRKLEVDYKLFAKTGRILERRRKIDDHKDIIVENTLEFLTDDSNIMITAQRYVRDDYSLSERRRAGYIEHEGIGEFPVTRELDKAREKVYKK